MRQPSGGESVAPPHDHEEETHHDAPSTPPADVTAQEELVEEVHRSSPPIVNVNVHRAPTPSAPPPVFAPAPDPELVSQLHDAQAEIERLRNLISSMPDPSSAPTTTTSPTELRRRHRPLSDDGSTYDGETEVGTYVSEDMLEKSEGVPLQVVIIIALGVFVTTYLFF